MKEKIPLLKISRPDLLRTVKNALLVVLGTLVLAFGTAVFLLPMNIVSGGISGLSIIFDLLLPFEFITVDLIVFILTWSFFLVGLFALGKPFAAKTLLSALVYPPAISLFLRLSSPDVLGGFFHLAGYPNTDLALILAATVGGVCVGTGCAITFIGGGSTGGVDILAFTLCKFFHKMKSSVVIFAIDATIVVLGMAVLRNLPISLLGILSAFIAAIMIDKVFLGGRAAFVAYIVTKEYESINRVIIEKIDRTTTILDAVGGYSSEGRKMLMVTFTMSQYADLLSVIGKEDPRAFVIVHRVHEINGEGWHELK